MMIGSAFAQHNPPVRMTKMRVNGTVAQVVLMMQKKKESIIFLEYGSTHKCTKKKNAAAV